MTIIETTDSRSAQKSDERIALTNVVYSGQKGGPHNVRVYISDRGRSDMNAGHSKKGPIDAIAIAIQNMVPHDAKINNYSVHAVTEGSDASAEVTIVLKNHAGEYEGKGTDTDTLIASASAYVNALNKLLTH